MSSVGLRSRWLGAERLVRHLNAFEDLGLTPVRKVKSECKRLQDWGQIDQRFSPPIVSIVNFLFPSTSKSPGALGTGEGKEPQAEETKLNKKENY